MEDCAQSFRLALRCPLPETPPLPTPPSSCFPHSAGTAPPALTTAVTKLFFFFWSSNEDKSFLRVLVTATLPVSRIEHGVQPIVGVQISQSSQVWTPA